MKLNNFLKSGSRKYKQIREAFMQLFVDRELVTMIQPCEVKEDCEKIDETGFEILSEEF